MKVLEVDNIRAADQYTMQHEPISSLDLMERAAGTVSQHVLKHYGKHTKIVVLLGKGNNAGDGLVIARHLADYGYDLSLSFFLGKSGSDDFNANLERLAGRGIPEIDDVKALNSDNQEVLLIDAVFGSGLDRPVEGEIAEKFETINQLPFEVLAIDIPSGMFADKSSRNSRMLAADLCISFQFPKLAFFAPENHPFIKKWIVKDIGLHPDFIDKVESEYSYLHEYPTFSSSLNAFSHKGDRGRIAIVAGGFARMGAAILSARAALRSGGGLISVQAVSEMIPVIHTALPEALILEDDGDRSLQSLLNYDRFDALVIGPALGTGKSSVRLLEHILKQYKGQLIIDADAITILSEHRELIQNLPEDAVLTPHIGEFDRLIENKSDFFSRLMQLKLFCKHHKITMVLKGKYTAICSKNGQITFNSTGNNGMAKGGSGDVLAGIIAGLCTNVKNIFDSTVLAVFLHGRSADVMVRKINENSLTPSDIIEGLGYAFKNLTSRTKR